MVKHQPGVPAMAIDDHRVPFVQQDGLPGTNAAHAGAAVEPELHEALVQQESHKVPSQVVSLAAQQDDAVEGLWTELDAQLDVLVGAMEGREGQPGSLGKARYMGT